ncbi:hypothetical protein AAE478_006170 [Parahypoxylon ruwenzoriense]
MASTETFVPNSFSTDDETFSLIVNLLLEDVQQAASSAKGKQKEGVISDADLALRLYAEELGNAAVFASDRRMTRSVQRAIQADGDALGQSEREERMARNDREISAALSRGIDPAPNATTVDDADPSNAELEIFDKLSAIYVDGIDDDDDLEVRTLLGGQPESSSWAAVRQSRRTTPKRNCLACDETKHFTDIARAPCGHEYCRDCLAQLFQNAMTDEAYFPPRCCREAIPLEPNQMFLSPDLVRQFRVKSVEFSTPRRTYCFRPTCSAFIPPSRCQRDIATCGECGHQTCITCKGPSHFGDCPHDQSLQQVLQIADQEGWQRCTNCLSMIELNTGCFHMTINIILVALAVQNSATSAVRRGKFVDAANGTNPSSLIEPRKSTTETKGPARYITHMTWMSSRLLSERRALTRLETS